MILNYTVKNTNLNNLDTSNNISTINSVLKNKLHISTRLLKKLISDKLVLLNNSFINTNSKVNALDVISIDFSYKEDNSNILPNSSIELDILYEDNWLLILNKPSGIPVHPSVSTNINSLSNGVKAYFDKIGLNKKIRPVNRLDIYTSGIVIFAKCEYIQECLITQMNTNIFKKEYLCFCLNNENCNNTNNYLQLLSKSTLSFPISRKPGSILERMVDDDGQISITDYELINTFKDIKNNITYSFLKCFLKTRENSSNTRAYELYRSSYLRRYFIWYYFKFNK